jgi:hypothetical protein
MTRQLQIDDDDALPVSPAPHRRGLSRVAESDAAVGIWSGGTWAPVDGDAAEPEPLSRA